MVRCGQLCLSFPKYIFYMVYIIFLNKKTCIFGKKVAVWSSVSGANNVVKYSKSLECTEPRERGK